MGGSREFEDNKYIHVMSMNQIKWTRSIKNEPPPASHTSKSVQKCTKMFNRTPRKIEHSSMNLTVHPPPLMSRSFNLPRRAGEDRGGFAIDLHLGLLILHTAGHLDL